MKFIIILTILFSSCNNARHEEKKLNTPILDTIQKPMSDTTRKDILQEIDVSIRSGFYNKEEIFENVEEYLYDIPFDHKWTENQIDKAYSNRLKEQSTWPAVTDFDRLVKAFDKLNESGIVALHKAGMTKQDGEGDSNEIHEDLLKEGIRTKGFCYYHWQDVARVIDDSHLYIGFGDLNNNDREALAIGKQVASTLERYGFKLNWDKTLETRIQITNINWQKRFGNEFCSYERAEKLLSHFKN